MTPSSRAAAIAKLTARDRKRQHANLFLQGQVFADTIAKLRCEIAAEHRRAITARVVETILIASLVVAAFAAAGVVAIRLYP